jgi:transposase InsO family protein
MKYDNEFVKRITDSVIQGLYSIREASQILHVARNTISTWVSRTKAGLPARFKRSAKRVWNRTSDEVLVKVKDLLASGNTVVRAWQALGKKLSMRTIERWNAVWFPIIEERKECKRYVRKKAFSLVHTDWGVKRILSGQRTCFTFHEDDATRRLFALQAYKQANQNNTNDCLRRAWKETKGFKAVLSDCGKVYTKSFGEECKAIGTKSIHTRPYNPKCNGKAEAVVKKVKAFLNKHEVRDLKHMNELLKQFQKEYNNTPHSSLKYLTPKEVFRAKQRTGSVWAVG